ncbi:hypothetical protein [Nocardia stercoris]|nr:hypothetical protein [Nocardia stercoris]
MTSTSTRHFARCVGGDFWVVSWLPGRTLTERQAAAAMTIAVTVSRHPQDDTAWVRLDGLALELGLTGREAAGLVALSSHDLRLPPRSRPA